MKTTIQLTAALLLLPVARAAAQREVAFAHHTEVATYFNPAAVGARNCLNVAGAYTLGTGGEASLPRAGHLGADMPLTFLPGGNAVGVSVFDYKLAQNRHRRWAAQYAYGFNIGGGRLSLGVQGGVVTERLRVADGGTASDGTTLATETDTYSGAALDLGAGLWYTTAAWHAGLSVQHANAPRVKLDEYSGVRLHPAYYFTAGYNIKLINPFIKIQPSVLLRADSEGFRADVSGRVTYQSGGKRLYGGASYSPRHSLTLLAGGAYKGFSLGYGYEFHNAGAAKGGGGHHIQAGFNTDLKLGKKARHKKKSVRFL